jgi:hypothetical protein
LLTAAKGVLSAIFSLLMVAFMIVDCSGGLEYERKWAADAGLEATSINDLEKLNNMKHFTCSMQETEKITKAPDSRRYMTVTKDISKSYY